MERLMGTTGLLWSVMMLPVHAAPSAPPMTPPAPPIPECVQPALSQPQMIACAERHVSQADGKLDKLYRLLLGSTERDLKAKLIASERSWVQYRRIDCAFFGAGNGSLARVNELSCQSRLTESRLAELSTWPPVPERSDLPHGAK